MVEEKKCIKCGVIKPLSEFNHRRLSVDGYRNECRLCRKNYNATYQKINSEKIAEQQAKYRIDNHEKIKKRQSEYYANNIEENIKKSNKLLKHFQPSLVFKVSNAA
ncbi:MAG: hypothetical protein WA151_09710 [Desulfatirhabdiaceae bacterium]